LRLFVAVRFAASAIAAILERTRILREHAMKGNFTAPDNLHLTLAFLGETDPADLTALCIVLASVQTVPFDLTLSGMLRFDRGKDGIFGLRADGGSALSELAAQVRAILASEGFACDPKPFVPHLTIARMCDATEDGVAAAAALPPILSHVTAFALMSSSRDNGALVYRPLRIFPCRSEGQ